MTKKQACHLFKELSHTTGGLSKKEIYELNQNLSLYRTEYINFNNFLQAIFWHDGELLVFELQEH
jgi:hypothetical protein